VDDHDSFMGMGLLLAYIRVPELHYTDYTYIMTNDEMNLTTVKPLKQPPMKQQAPV